MSYTQDKAHSSAILGAILDGEKAQQQQQQQQQSQSRTSASDSASIFSTSSFGSAKSLLKKAKPSKSESKSKSDSKSSSGPTEAELSRTAQRNQWMGRLARAYTMQRSNKNPLGRSIGSASM
ncbi:hypothetical protein K449DRAFT_436733 [Hypoxylon sp. EC38]|nr:hypothetical protein K449DRAFT_436733 [Hypoxylon sp. EC38]